jgi:hypothetical protein
MCGERRSKDLEHFFPKTKIHLIHAATTIFMELYLHKINQYDCRMAVPLLLVALLTLQRTSTAAVRGSPSIVGSGTLPSPSQTVSSEEVTTALGNYNYDRVLELSLLFYEAQRSGHLPKENRVPWRSDSCLKDRGQHGEDLEGGYYDGECSTLFNLELKTQHKFFAI